MIPIAVLAELDNAKTAYTAIDENEVAILCPFHSDKNPSCHVSTTKRVYYCRSCGAKGDVFQLFAAILGIEKYAVFTQFADKYGDTKDAIVEASVIEKWHQGIWQAPELRQELYNRGVTDEIIRQWRLGVTPSKDRITIPIKNSFGLYVNVRRYKPGASVKFTNMRGRGRARLYPISQLSYRDIVICGGEIKAIVAAEHLNKHGIGAITCTSGEGNWRADFDSSFCEKNVWVCLDIDREGESAANNICARISRVANTIHKIDLPLDIEKFPHGDINDFVVNGGDLYSLVSAAQEWVPPTVAVKPYADPIPLALVDAIRPSNADTRCRVSAMVSAVDQNSYLIPKNVEPSCTKDQDFCAVCPLFTLVEGSTIQIPSEHNAILAMVDSPSKIQIDELKRALDIPPCKVVKFDVVDFYKADDIRIAGEIDSQDVGLDSTLIPVVVLDSEPELNTTYEFTGRFTPHPKTQSQTFLASQAEAQVDALASFELDAPEDLQIFQPSDWSLSALAKKIDNIYADLENTVTRIYDRRDMHIAFDLAYHSCLRYGEAPPYKKGWVEVLVVGDSAQGKSETASNLRRHYGLGEIIECKNVTVAGLIGGLQQLHGKWFMSWGAMPTHDGRLLIFEELKGMRPDVFAKLTDVRSSGIANITKIQRRKVNARTRLIAISNPKSNLPISAYNYGITAICELVAGLEDIRRFDISMVLSKNDIDASVGLRAPSLDSPQYTSRLCQNLIMWSWTRKPHHISITTEALDSVAEHHKKLCDTFDDRVPIVDRGTMQHKLTRLAIALACRTFSCDEAYEKVIVRPCHVEFIAEYLLALYSTPTHGYADFSKQVREQNKLRSADEVLRNITALPYPRDFVDSILSTEDIDVQDLQNWCDWEIFEARTLLSLLVRNRALIRQGRHYKKTEQFISLLRNANGQIPVMPKHIEKRKEEF